MLIEKILAADPLTLTPNMTTGSDLTGLISKITGWVFILAGVIAFFYLIYSGFIYLTAGGNADAAKKGQQGIINAIIGLVIIFLAYAIITAVINLLNTGK